MELADSVTTRIRTDHVRCYCISVNIRNNKFQNRSHQRKLDEATDITKEVYEVSKELLAELWKNRTPLRLIGISLMQIVHENEIQMSFFQDKNKERARKLDHAMDDIRSRYGLDKVKRGSTFQNPLEIGKKYRAQFETKKE